MSGPSFKSESQSRSRKIKLLIKGAASAIAAQRQSNGGLPIFGEPIAAGLALDGSHYFNEDFSHAAAFVLS